MAKYFIEPEGEAQVYKGGMELDDIQKLLHGPIRSIFVDTSIVMLVDKEGHLRKSHFNGIASSIAYERITGTVLLLTNEDAKEWVLRDLK